MFEGRPGILGAGRCDGVLPQHNDEMLRTAAVAHWAGDYSFPHVTHVYTPLHASANRASSTSVEVMPGRFFKVCTPQRSYIARVT
jgi:hypothetical protein